jgi:hypothetical protein
MKLTQKQHQICCPCAQQDEVDTLTAALKVLVLTPHVRAYLAVMDPKALKQAQQALGLPVAPGGSPALVELMESFRGTIYREIERPANQPE